MKYGILLFGITLFCSCNSVLADPGKTAANRAHEFAIAWSQQRYEDSWKKKIIPEYIHPNNNDSGLQSRFPDFLPKIDFSNGTYLLSTMTLGSIKEGRSPYILQGMQNVFCIEVVYTIIAEVNEVVIIYSEPQTRIKYYVMAIDDVDKKWKIVDSYPYGAYFYSIPYFLKNWEKISGKDSISNIEEVITQLKLIK